MRHLFNGGRRRIAVMLGALEPMAAIVQQVATGHTGVSHYKEG